MWLLIPFCIASVCTHRSYGHDNLHEFQRFDGWYNNLAHRDWGSAFTPLCRRADSAYADRVSKMMGSSDVNARRLSNAVFAGKAGLPSRRNATTFMAFFAQLVEHEVVDTGRSGCPVERHNIVVAKCDAHFDPDCLGNVEIPFSRAQYDDDTGGGLNMPREQINHQTSWIDASFLYGTAESYINEIRLYTNGLLDEEPTRAGYPPVHWSDRTFILAYDRTEENAGLLSIVVVFWRWHNHLAKRIQANNPNWSDEAVFNTARRWVIATLQNIIMYEFLPAYLGADGQLPEYTGYKSDTSPGVTHVCAAGAFFFYRTMFPPALLLRDSRKSCAFRTRSNGERYETLRLCNHWHAAHEILLMYPLEDVLLGMSSQVAEREDHVVVDDVRNFFPGDSHFTRRDAVAGEIMKGRDHGLADYSAVRKSLGLPLVATLQALISDPELLQTVSTLYNGSIDKLDLLVGGMLEESTDGPGETFRSAMRDQFMRLRDSDRFWFENRKNNMFTLAEIEEIKAIRLSDILLNTTRITPHQLQRNVFFVQAADPCKQPFQVGSPSDPSDLEACIPLMLLDRFAGNEVTFIYTLIGLAVVPIACAGIAWALVRHRRATFSANALLIKEIERQRRQTARQQRRRSSGAVVRRVFTVRGKHSVVDEYRVNAIEWLHGDYVRQVMVLLNQRDAKIVIEKPRNRCLLRTIDGKRLTTTEISVTVSERNSGRNEQPFLLLTLPEQYDIVLRFDSRETTDNFLSQLEAFAVRIKKTLSVHFAQDAAILSAAETKEKRQAKLEKFFRDAYAVSFHLPGGPKMSTTTASNGVASKRSVGLNEAVLRTKLTRAEFSDALGMKENDIFIERMFAIVVKTHQDQISFGEFLDIVIKFSSGDVRDQMEIIFDMCDRDKSGVVDKEEFITFMKALNTAVGVTLTEAAQVDLMNEMLANVGLSTDKRHFDRNDFERLFGELQSRGRPIGLHLKGVKQELNTDDRESLRSFAVDNEDDSGGLWRKLSALARLVAWLEDRRQHIAILSLFFLFTGMIFMERFWHYQYEAETGDGRRMMGMGVALARGSAAALSFCYALIPLTVCRNIITRLRLTPLNRCIPFDSAIVFHKIVAVAALLFSVIHTLAHCSNFYHLTTQSAHGLECIFLQSYLHDFKPTVTFWFYGTVTGITGILLCVIISVVYVFAAPAVVNGAYHVFRVTHFLNIMLYIVTVAHGVPRLLESPKFLWFVIGPLTVYAVDRLIALRQDYVNLAIVDAEILPSNVVHLKFERPTTFEFRSGNWIRIACPQLEGAAGVTLNQRHAFSIASAPQDRTLELFIKTIGPWTCHLRRAIQLAQMNLGPYPLLHMDGPYGGGNQEWRNYEVAVLVGGGIGITPYAAILSDLVQATAVGANFSTVLCKKVYFLWVCASHKNFEWFVDVLRTVEGKDSGGVLDIHIFITQFFHKYDLRTTMLYICEKHFRGVAAGRSMFTNLRAANHFGRPQFDRFLKFVQKEHIEQSRIGVFSCGPALMNRNLHDACKVANQQLNRPRIIHRFETF